MSGRRETETRAEAAAKAPNLALTPTPQRPIPARRGRSFTARLGDEAIREHWQHVARKRRLLAAEAEADEYEADYADGDDWR